MAREIERGLHAARNMKAVNMGKVAGLLVETEVTAGIVVRNVFDHTAQRGIVIGYQSILHIGTYQVAEQAAEVLMARIAEERARVGKHAHEARQQP